MGYMTVAANQYANKVFSEHPIAMWPMDEQAYYLSMIDDNDRLLTNWTNGGEDRVNLVTNPSFETNATGWSVVGTGATSALNTTHKYIGSQSVALTVGTANSYYQIATNIPVIPNKTYTLSSYLKLISGTSTGGTYIEIVWRDAASAVISLANNNGLAGVNSTDWTRHSITSTAPANAAFAQIRPLIATVAANPTGTQIAMDAVMFEQSPSAGTFFDGSYGGGAWTGAANASASVIHVKDRVNLVANSSFEVTPYSSYWALNIATAITQSTAVAPLAGTYVALITHAANAASGIYTAEMPVTVGKTYTGSIYVRDVNSAVQYRVGIYYYDAAHLQISSSFGTSTTVSSASWTRLSHTSVAPANAVYSRMAIYVATAPTVGTQCYVESALFEESTIPYPYFDATFSLVSYGGTTYSISPTFSGTVNASASTISWATKSNSPTIPDDPSPFDDDVYSSFTRSTPLAGVVDIQSPDLFNSTNVDINNDQFTINAFLYQNPTYINWFKIGYRYYNAGGVLQEVISDEIPAPSASSWVNLNQTYTIPTSWSGSIKAFIQVNFKDSTAGDAASRTVILHGFSVGQGSATTCYESLGSTPISIPAEFGYTGMSGISADQYGVLADNGYYLVRSNQLLANNDGMPIIYGTNHSTAIHASGVGLPSFVFPGKGMLHETGRNKAYTLEMWMKLDPQTTRAQRILGPMDSLDGLYVKEGFLTLAIGGEIGSHFVSDWYRPMLVNIELKDNSATVILNGEQVISIPFDRKTVDLPDGNDWWGVYSYSTISYFNIDCISIFPYNVSATVAKRHFVYGQGTPNIQSIDNAYRGTPTTIEFATSEYDASVIYPDIARWDAGYFNNLTATRDYLSVPNYTLPIINIGGRDLKEWYGDNLTINNSEYPDGQHPKFVSLRPNTVTRTNYVRNPSFETNLTNWYALSSGGLATLSRITSASKIGTASGQIVRATNAGATEYPGMSMSAVDIPIVAGRSYTYSFWIKKVSGIDPNIFGTIAWADASATYITENQTTWTVITAAAGWVRLSVTATAPANAKYCWLLVREQAVNGAAASTWTTDGHLFEEGSLMPYFDGSYADPEAKPISYGWTGTAHASNSTLSYWNPNGINYQDPAYFNFPTLNALNEAVAAVYGVFQADSNIASDRTLMSFVNITNGETFDITINGTDVDYSINGTVLNTDVITIGTEFAVGLNFNEAGTYFFNDGVSKFFSSPASIQLYVGGNGINTFEGKIYSVGLANAENFRKIQDNFDATGLVTPNTYALLLDHFASYTLLPEYEYGELYLDVSVSSQWEEYYPLSYFASYVEDGSGNPVYDIDMLQVNIGYPTVATSDVWTYAELKTEFTTPNDYADLRDSIYLDYFGLKKKNATGSTVTTANSSLQSYLTFQPIADGANRPLADFPYSAGLEENAVIYADMANTFVLPEKVYDTKFLFKDNVVVFPPKTNNFEDYALVVHLEINQRSILKNPLKIKSMEISANNFNYISDSDDPAQRNYIGTKFGKKVYPYTELMTLVDHKVENPLAIHKTSTPYLYTTRKSGIRLVNESLVSGSPSESRVFIPINESGSLRYNVAAIQFMVKPEFVEDDKTIKFIEIKHKNGRLLYGLSKIGGSGTLSSYGRTSDGLLLDGGTPTPPTFDYIFDGGTPTSVYPPTPYLNITTDTNDIVPVVDTGWSPVYGSDYYQNGRYVPSPVLENNEWSVVGIVFPEPLDFSEFADGGITIFGGAVFNNISYYLEEGLGVRTDLTTRTWQGVYDVDGTVPSGTTWAYWAGDTWQYVYLLGQASSYISSPADIYEAYVGTNSEIVDDGYGLTFDHRQAQLISGATWSIYTSKPA